MDNKLKLIVLVTFATIVLLLSSVSFVFANPIVGTQSNVILSSEQTGQNDSQDKWSKIRQSFVEQLNSDKEEIRQLIEQGIGSNLSSSIVGHGDSLRDSYDNCIATVCFPWHTEGGYVYNEDAVEGPSDEDCAHLDATGYNSEAFIVSQMNAMSIGSISITCNRGEHANSSWSWSYVSVYLCQYGDDWSKFDRIDKYVTWDTLTEVDIGESSEPFRYVSIATWSPDPSYPQCLDVDSLSAEPYTPSFVLTISTDGHGTTDPAPGGYNYYGETAEIEAIPYTNYQFTYWDVDGNSQSTENPIQQETWDSDHYLTAHFTYVPPQQSLTISASGGGTTDPSPGTHWYNYNSGIEVDAVGSGFSYWLLDGEYISTGTSITVTMDQYHTLEAHFNQQIPVCEVTINAIEASSSSYAEADVYVDSQYVDTTDTAYNVANLQQHTIAGSASAYVPHWQAYGSSYWTEVNGEFYDYGVSATVTPASLHMTITFVYICAK